MIDAYLNDESWEDVLEKYLEKYNKLFEEEKEEYGDLPNGLPIIMEGYINQYKNNPLKPLEYNNRKSEYEFKVPLIPKYNISLIGYIDRAVKDEKGMVWLTEIKSKKKIPDDEERFSDIQTALYCWVMPKIGLPKPDGVLWDYIRAKVPTKPKVLKRGGLSKRKNIDTTYQTYLDTIKENNLNPDDYKEILERLKGKTTDFYRRIFLPSPDSIIKQLVPELRDTAREIYFLGGKLKDRNIQRNCTWWCDYYEICQAELRGLDTKYIREHEYERRRRD